MFPNELLVLIVVIGIPAQWIFSVLSATVVGDWHGRAGFGFMLGFFLGPFGLLIACLLPDVKKTGSK